MIKRIKTNIFFWLFLISIIINILFFFLKNENCNEIKEKKQTQPLSFIEKKDVRKRLIKRIIDSADTKAYDSLKFIYQKNNEDVELLPYSILMANKWKNRQSEFDVYFQLIMSFNCKGMEIEKQMDEKSRRMAIEYLQLSAKHGHIQANEVINDYYPELQKKKK